MKKVIVTLVVLSVFFIAGCSIFMDDARLEGKWQTTSVDIVVTQNGCLLYTSQYCCGRLP